MIRFHLDQHVATRLANALRRRVQEIKAPALTCWPVLTEASYLLRRYPRDVTALLSRCDGTRFQIVSLSASDLPGILAILRKYADQNFSLADAAVMHLAERDGIEHVFTIDHRHFSIYRTQAGGVLQILPA